MVTSRRLVPGFGATDTDSRDAEGAEVVVAGGKVVVLIPGLVVSWRMCLLLHEDCGTDFSERGLLYACRLGGARTVLLGRSGSRRCVRSECVVSDVLGIKA